MQLSYCSTSSGVVSLIADLRHSLGNIFTYIPRIILIPGQTPEITGCTWGPISRLEQLPAPHPSLLIKSPCIVSLYIYISWFSWLPKLRAGQIIISLIKALFLFEIGKDINLSGFWHFWYGVTIKPSKLGLSPTALNQKLLIPTSRLGMHILANPDVHIYKW